MATTTSAAGLAASRVFAIPELTENILLKLPVQDMVLATSVCKAWRSIVLTSSHARKRLLAWRYYTAEDAAQDHDSIPSGVPPTLGNPSAIWMVHVEHNKLGLLIAYRSSEVEIFLLLSTLGRYKPIVHLPSRLATITPDIRPSGAGHFHLTLQSHDRKIILDHSCGDDHITHTQYCHAARHKAKWKPTRKHTTYIPPTPVPQNDRHRHIFYFLRTFYSKRVQWIPDKFAPGSDENCYCSEDVPEGREMSWEEDWLW